ncbi:hypothetical protein BSK66_26760 [Paenibacillus odorifer]|uniref:hypothetical protein n=1 Tax=Paenibacillus TaxID=44249 RepID=UPI0003E2099E|nr:MULTISPECIES: hypothetical protein [Paenibacillus]ETT49350.1 hypothetical protein C171_23795 [Paenibacillus sp. FSL H8-237]OME49562.1 hypothetical protein BSK66_26760 [Paenibacillus odorifer]
MRYGSREIMDVVLKDKKTGEPKVYLESLTTSTIELAGSTVYARGGKGHPKLIGWDSEKDITMNMEDALISKESLSILTGSKFKKASKIVHKKEVVDVLEDFKVTLAKIPLASQKLFIYKTKDGTSMDSKVNHMISATPSTPDLDLKGVTGISVGDKLIFDYYYTSPITTQSIEITSDIFPGTYLLEGTTLWRNEDGYDVEALYTVPKLKVLPNFSIPMASTGDPTPFIFTCEVLKDTSSTAMVIIDLLEEE